MAMSNGGEAVSAKASVDDLVIDTLVEPTSDSGTYAFYLSDRPDIRVGVTVNTTGQNSAETVIEGDIHELLEDRIQPKFRPWLTIRLAEAPSADQRIAIAKDIAALLFNIESSKEG